MAEENSAQFEQEPPAPVGETKAQKFQRLATYRMRKALERIEQIKHLANRSQYEYTPEQLEKMHNALLEQIEHVFSKFDDKPKDQDTGFSF